ncbi:MAG: metallopeptidase family protein [Candidatus Aminicenantales bacterium]|jgi:predicted Zn-dependent protease with MMP-like domain
MRRIPKPFGKSPFLPLMEKAEFERLVEEALAGIPSRFKKLIENLTVMVEDEAPPGRPLLGLYHGVPYTHRSPGYYGNIPPDVIVIYQGPIERISRGPEEIKDNVRDTVLHEVGHYFGMGEDELREIEKAVRRSRPGEKK